MTEPTRTIECIEELESEFLTSSEVAEALNLTRVRVWQMTVAGEIPAKRIGRNYYYTRETLAKLVAARKQR